MGLAGWAVLGGIVGYVLWAIIGEKRGYISFVLTFAAAGVAVGLALHFLELLWGVAVIVVLIAVVGGIISAARGR
ncbi:MAG TPA: hypothetical protein DGT21_20095 [Armatimonadetes bacterium]|jgi:hypothetical protein|nr:hypothetical protein [Armatimonadota bacterium]